jgi:ABC-2 type transport system permease protein
MNPMIRKELRQRMRERRSWVLPSLYLAALGASVTLAYFFSTEGFPFQMAEPQGAQVGISVFLTIAYAQMALLLLLVPVFSAGSLTIEKEQRTLAMLLTSLLSPVEIWVGKFVSAMLFTTLLLVSSLPVFSLAFSLGGIGPEDLLRATTMTLLVLASISAMGLYFSSIFRRSVHSTAVSYAAVIALTAITFIIFSILQSHWETSRARLNQSAEAAPTGMPKYYTIPLYLNPFYALTASLTRPHQKFPDWIISALVFLALGLLAASLAFRNIRRQGESG